MSKNWIVFGLSNSSNYAEVISKKVKIELGEIITSKFADGEILVKSKQTVREKDVLLIQSTSNPVNDNLMELLISIDALKRASAKSIFVLIPYYGYGRQDRKSKGREPITCKLVASFLESAGANKVLLIDIHSEQTQGFFNIPVDTLRASVILLLEFIKKNKTDDNFCMVASDYGAVKKARDIATHLNLDLAIIDKRRPKPNVAEVCNVLGDIKDKNCLLIDDMIDTGGTIISAAMLLKKNGAKKVSMIATHGLFSNGALLKIEKILDSEVVDNLYITDTIQKNLEIKHDKIIVIKLGDFLGDVINSHIHHQSVSDLYETRWDTLFKKWYEK
ncbi:MAG: ribose-phosphate pyrophosphokinase [Malacoplasma sp.]